MSVFDAILRPPSRTFMLLESRALFEVAAYYQARPALRRVVPRGDGHPVLVLPGFLATDRSTWFLRTFLNERHYAAQRWELGRNLVFNLRQMKRLVQRVETLTDHYGIKVSLIGWSMGGLYARAVAQLRPDCIRLVITLGSPFACSLKANNAHWLYRLITGQRVDEIDPHLLKCMQEPPPVPTTAIYSCSDGIVAWQCCMEQRAGPLIENVRVRGSHCGLGHNPMVLFVIGDRLAQPEGHWTCFKRTGLKKLLYPPHVPGQEIEIQFESIPAALQRRSG